MIGHRLKLARESAGLSLRDLEEKIGAMVTAQAIGKYERDEMMPSSAVLLAISKALSVAPEYLLSQRELELAEVDFRKGPAASSKEERGVEAAVIDVAERYLELEDVVPGAHIQWRAPDRKDFIVDLPEAAEHAAEKLRSIWKLGVDPIPSMVELLEERGIKVVALELPEAVSGSKAFARQDHRDAVALIVVNSRHNGERQRFTLAHELGHLVLQFPEKASENLQEKSADRFAGAFLVAADMLRELAGAGRKMFSIGELVSLKQYFKVSVATIVVRCRQLGILGQTAYNRLWGLIKAKGWITQGAEEPAPIAPEKPIRMERLCLRAVAECMISESKAAELLKISRKELERRLDFQIA